jgi:hypothetical protein
MTLTSRVSSRCGRAIRHGHRPAPWPSPAGPGARRLGARCRCDNTVITIAPFGCSNAALRLAMDGHESRRPRSEGGGVPAGSGQTLRLAAAARRRPPGARRRPRRPGTWSLSRVRADGPHTPAPRRAVRAGRRAGGAIGLGRHAGGATVTVQRPTRNLNSRPGNLNFLQANSNLQSAVLESFRVCDRQGDRDSESLAAWAAPDSGDSDDSEGRFGVARPGPGRGPESRRRPMARRPLLSLPALRL